jgi:hypothetical protein
LGTPESSVLEARGLSFDGLGNRALLSLLRSGCLQRSAGVSEPGDPLEQEADRVADQVMRMPAPELSIAAAPVHVSFKCAACEEDERVQTADRVMRMADPGVAAVRAPLEVSSKHPSHSIALESEGSAVAPPAGQVPAGPGRPLEPDLRQDMGRRFGRDFSRVRLHTDERASESAAALGANAYTVGQHVVFNRGAWDPVSAKGRRLIAHELVHTIQQRGNPQPTVACQFGPLPDTPGGVAAEIQIVQQQWLAPIQPLRPALEIRLQALYAQWHKVGGDAQPAATAPKPKPKKLTPEEETALKAQAVLLAHLEVYRRSFCRFMNDRADWYAKLRLTDPAFREEMKALHVVYDEKSQSFEIDTKWKYTFNDPYADSRSPFYLHSEAAEIYRDIINAYLYPPEEKGIARKILDPIVHTICEYTDPCSSNMVLFHKDLESGMSRAEAINNGMARLTTQALLAFYPSEGPRGPIALPPEGAPPVVPFEPPGGTPPGTGLTPQTVPDVPPVAEPSPVAKPATTGGTPGKLPTPQKPTLIASSEGKPPEPAPPAAAPPEPQEPRGSVKPSGEARPGPEVSGAAGDIGEPQQQANRIATDPEYRQDYIKQLRRAGYTRAAAQRVAAAYEDQFARNPGQQDALTLATLWRLYAELL